MPCNNLESCVLPTDCKSGVCEAVPVGTAIICQPPSCTDGVQNGSETGVDCGGSCPPCAM